MLSQFAHDARLAWRGFARAKLFTGAAVILLAAGVAGTTAMVALFEGVLLRPLPVPHQDRVVLAWKDLENSGYRHYPFGDRDIIRVRENSRLLERVAGVTTNGVSQWLAVEGTSASHVSGALVAGAFFDVLDVPPLLGRRLAASDDVEGAEPVIVISARLWARRYGRSRDVIGRRLMLDEHSFTIVGVMPADIDYPRGVELWRPTRSVPLTQTFGAAARQEIDLIARLRPGVTPAQAHAELSALAKRFEAEQPAALRNATVVVRGFDDAIVGSSRPAIVALLAAVCLVLLIANANVANLLLMRAETRRGELAVQMALGAGARRITRQLLIEGVMLGLFGAAAGIIIASIGLSSLIAMVPDGVPRPEAVHIDAMTVMMVTALTIVAVLLTTVGPAVLSTRIELATELRGSGRGATTATGRVRRLLLISQVALALTVVAGAGVLIRTVLRLQSTDVGVPVSRLAIAFLEMPKGKYTDEARHANFLQSAVESLEAVPMIAAATPVNNEPFAVSWGVPTFFAEGQDADRAATNPALGLEAVHENYFKTLGIRILRGRAFTSADRKGTVDVTILSEDAAARTWPGQDPIGKRLKWGSQASRNPWLTVVGVAAKTRYQDLASVKPTIYVPAVQFVVAAQRLIVRSEAPVDRIAAAVRETIARIDPDVRVMRVSPFGAMYDAPLAHPRFNALLLGIFAGIALLLTCVGQYAVIAAHVRQREREIAIRMALGATAWEVRRLVLSDVLRLGATGAAVGFVGALVAARLLRGFLVGVDGLDPPMLGGAALLLIAASTLSTLTPVRRAARIDAPTLLRS